MNTLKEILEKASDRIKRGKRTSGDKKKPTSQDINDAVASLLNSPSLSPSAKRKLKAIHKEHTESKDRSKKQGNEKIGGLLTVSDKSNPISAEKWKGDVKDLKSDKELLEEGAKNVKQRADTREKIQQYVDEGGEVEEYERQGKAPEQTMRSKSAEKLTGGVRHKMATGEGIAVRDKAYGENLDTQARLKREVQRKQDEKKPDVINVAGGAYDGPEIPEEHAEHPAIKGLMELRSQSNNKEHHAMVDTHIQDYVNKLNLENKFKKSSDDEQLVFSSGGQWTLI